MECVGRVHGDKFSKACFASVLLGGVIGSLLLAVAVAAASWERNLMRVDFAQFAAEVATVRGEKEELLSRVAHLGAEIDDVRAELALQSSFIDTLLGKAQDPRSASVAADASPTTAAAEEMPRWPLHPGQIEGRPRVSPIMSGHARRLEIIGSVYLSGSAEPHSGCVQYTEVGARTVDMANPTAACNGNKCPPCFVLNPTSALALTVTNCGASYVTNSLQLGDANTDRESSLAKFTFINVQSTNTVTDGAGNTATLAAGATYKAWCMSNGLATGVSGVAHRFYWEEDVS